MEEKNELEIVRLSRSNMAILVGTVLLCSMLLAIFMDSSLRDVSMGMPQEFGQTIQGSGAGDSVQAPPDMAAVGEYLVWSWDGGLDGDPAVAQMAKVCKALSLPASEAQSPRAVLEQMVSTGALPPELGITNVAQLSGFDALPLATKNGVYQAMVMHLAIVAGAGGGGSSTPPAGALPSKTEPSVSSSSDVGTVDALLYLELEMVCSQKGQDVSTFVPAQSLRQAAITSGRLSTRESAELLEAYTQAFAVIDEGTTTP